MKVHLTARRCGSWRLLYGTSGPRGSRTCASSRFLLPKKGDHESNAQRLVHGVLQHSSSIVRLPVPTPWQGVGECDRPFLSIHFLYSFCRPGAHRQQVHTVRLRCSSLRSLYGTSKRKGMAGVVIQGPHAGPAQATSRFPFAKGR